MNKQIKGEKFQKSAKCKNKISSPMSNLSWCDLKNKASLLKVNDIMCPNPKCDCQKQITFTPRKFQFKGAGFKKTKEKSFKFSQKAWNSFFKPAVNTLAHVIGMAVAAKSQIPLFGQTTTYILNSISGGKTLSLTNMHGNGLG